jgi:serine/threonine-protein kinase
MKRKSKSRFLFLVPLLALSAAAAGAAEARDSYGAIAYSMDTRSHAWTYDYPSRATAENEALLRCQSYGTGCFVATWFRNGCGALALASDGNGYGSGWARWRATAERLALGYCHASNGDCQVERWVCTSR